MKTSTIIFTIIIIIVVAVSLYYGVSGHFSASVDADASHQHDGVDCDGTHEEVADPHAGHDHGSEDGCDGDHEDVVTLSEKAIKLAGIESDVVKMGIINKVITLPGEIGFNEDKLVHITPRFGGVATKIMKNIGNYVKKGDELAIIQSNESMSSYSLKAPISGRIIEKHVSNGEFVSEETSIFVIADLSQVWINLSVYTKDADLIKIGQTVSLDCVGKDMCVNGVISYISHVYSEDTRRLTARVVLNNTDGKWKPGMFVKGNVNIETTDEKIIVSKNAVQIVNQKPAVFLVNSPTEFKPVNVVTGEKDDEYYEIISDEIKVGDQYVSNGAFEVKAHLVTSSLDAHAGHGH